MMKCQSQTPGLSLVGCYTIAGKIWGDMILSKAISKEPRLWEGLRGRIFKLKKEIHSSRGFLTFKMLGL